MMMMMMMIRHSLHNLNGILIAAVGVGLRQSGGYDIEIIP